MLTTSGIFGPTLYWGLRTGSTGVKFSQLFKFFETGDKLFVKSQGQRKIYKLRPESGYLFLPLFISCLEGIGLNG